METHSLNLADTIEEIKYLIQNSYGDTGRLSHILDAIKSEKKLYDSDRNFLENKLGTTFSLKDKEQKPVQTEVLKKIQALIDLDVGDSMLSLIHI